MRSSRWRATSAAPTRHAQHARRQGRRSQQDPATEIRVMGWDQRLRKRRGQREWEGSSFKEWGSSSYSSSSYSSNSSYSSSCSSISSNNSSSRGMGWGRSKGRGGALFWMCWDSRGTKAILFCLQVGEQGWGYGRCL